MNILGVCNANVSGACLLKDGMLVACVNEERFSRIKNHRVFPTQSIEYCLKEAELTIADIDYVACGAWGGIDENYLPELVEELTQAIVKDSSSKKAIDERTRVAIERDHLFKEELMNNLKNLGFRKGQIDLYDHHKSHAYTAFYPSPFNEALVFTLDGRGDFKSGTIWKASRRNGLTLMDNVSMYSSLGAFYGYFTKYLGFTPDKHEGKVTGLAAYGDSEKCGDLLRKMICIRDGKIRSNIGEYYTPFFTSSLPFIESELRNYKREDIAAALQKVTEEIVLDYLGIFLEKTKIKNVCLAGGVFGNVKINERILERDDVDNVYIFPQMGDGGNAYGGALIKYYELGYEITYPLSSVLLGPSFKDEEIIEVLEKNKNKITWKFLEEYSLVKVANDLSEGLIIGLLTGRTEYGPRALGSRSIIARASEIDINATLNKRLNRTEFMPFAPVTLEEFADSYYVGWEPTHMCSHFMTMCYSCTEQAIKKTPAIAHVDNTARPQIINSENSNPLYYRILVEYHKLTGIPTLINTSFNNHEEPIICSPLDAINSLLKNIVDFIIIENYVVFARGLNT